MKTTSEILTKFASAGTAEAITKLINRFYYSETFSFDLATGAISNKNGPVNGVKVSVIKGRFIFHSIRQSLIKNGQSLIKN